MKGIMVFVLTMSLLACCGCFGMLSRAIVKDVNPKMEEEELSHLSTVYAEGNKTLLSLANNKDLEPRERKDLIKLIDRTNKRANDIQPSALDLGVTQYQRLIGQQNVEAGLRTGFEWTKGAIGQLAGAGAGATGLGWLIPALIGRKKKRRESTEMKIYKEVVNENNLVNVARDKARHTDAENIIG